MIKGFDLPRFSRAIGVVALFLGATACQPSLQSRLPVGEPAYQAVAVAPETAMRTATQLIAGDKIRVDVYQEPDLTVPQMVVDAGGDTYLPLIGKVHAAGLSPDLLATQIGTAYARNYLRNPRVTVTLVDPAPRVLSVEGEVNRPGIYPIQTGYTLLNAISLAGSPKDTAKLNEVLVFRNIEGHRAGARFDLTAIRAGRAADPVLYPNDVIVVGFSRVQGAFRDLLQAAPLFNVFSQF
jgi:polysaccharide export outer membrane protein